jgi:5-(carboxyamino)imidazole ribonucleotide synthase
MTIQAAQRMGLRCLSLDPDVQSPASQLAPSILANLDDGTAIARLLQQCEHVTLENEFIPADSLRKALDESNVHPSILMPSVGTLAIIQDKWVQREALTRNGLPGPRAFPVSHAHEGGFPVVLKSRKGGYDGKGVRMIKNAEELANTVAEIQPDAWMAESFVPFRRELAVMVSIASDGAVQTFPTMETVQVDGVCSLVFPANVDASEIAIEAVRAVQGRGLFGVELFELDNGEIQINEIAPRPHNTGHYTLDWGGISQFEQHVRLCMNWPLSQETGQPTCMANLLGQPGAGDFRQAIQAAIQAVPDAHVHWYGKALSKPGRKMGHINVVGDNARPRAESARAAFYRGWVSETP